MQNALFALFFSPKHLPRHRKPPVLAFYAKSPFPPRFAWLLLCKQASRWPQKFRFAAPNYNPWHHPGGKSPKGWVLPQKGAVGRGRPQAAKNWAERTQNNNFGSIWIKSSIFFNQSIQKASNHPETAERRDWSPMARKPRLLCTVIGHPFWGGFGEGWVKKGKSQFLGGNWIKM